MKNSVNSRRALRALCQAGLVMICLVLASEALARGTVESTIVFRMSESDIRCMTDNVFWEAAGEGETGWKAVMAVTIHRVRDPRWAKTVCTAVYQKRQFSWTNPGWKPHRRKPIRDKKTWQRIESKVREWSKVGFTDPVAGATHYHATYVKPRWSRRFRLVRQVGLHKFYR